MYRVEVDGDVPRVTEIDGSVDLSRWVPLDEIPGLDVVDQAQEVRRLIGLSGQYAAVDENLTGEENLWLFGRLYQLPSREARDRARELRAETVDVKPAEHADRDVDIVAVVATDRDQPRYVQPQ